MRQVEGWIQQGVAEGATHVISVCDTFDYVDYPVYVYHNQDINEKKKQYDGTNMQRINEIIDLAKYKEVD